MLGRLAARAALVLLTLATLGGCVTSGGASQPALKPEPSDIQTRARIRLQLAMGYFEQRQLAVALEEVKLALQADPNFSEAYNVRGLIYMEMGEPAQADENFQYALRLDPKNPDLANNYGWFLCQNGQPARAITYFETAIKNPRYQSPGKALNNAGACSAKLKDMQTAQRYFLQAFQMDPGNPSTSINLARSFYEQRDYERARFYIGRVTRAEILTPEVLWLAVRIEHKLGDKLAEATMATQLRRRHPNSPEFLAYQRGAFDE